VSDKLKEDSREKEKRDVLTRLKKLAKNKKDVEQAGKLSQLEDEDMEIEDFTLE
jgi:hypothetical protein